MVSRCIWTMTGGYGLTLRLLSCLRMGWAPQNQPEAQLFSWYQKMLALRLAVSFGWASLRR